MKYKINIKRFGQDCLEFCDIKDKDYKLPSYLNFDEVINHSIQENYIGRGENIVSLCAGCDAFSAYFSNNSAEDECKELLSSFNIKFDPQKTEYNLY